MKADMWSVLFLASILIGCRESATSPPVDQPPSVDQVGRVSFLSDVALPDIFDRNAMMDLLDLVQPEHRVDLIRDMFAVASLAQSGKVALGVPVSTARLPGADTILTRLFTAPGIRQIQSEAIRFELPVYNLDDYGPYQGTVPDRCRQQNYSFFGAAFPYFEHDGFFFNANPWVIYRFLDLVGHTRARARSSRGTNIIDVSGTFNWNNAEITMSCWLQKYVFVSVPYAIVEAEHGPVVPINGDQCDDGPPDPPMLELRVGEATSRDMDPMPSAFVGSAPSLANSCHGGGGGGTTCYTLYIDHYWYYPDTGELEYSHTDVYHWCEME